MHSIIQIELENVEGSVVLMVGRNEPCPCGSGKKYKKCCEGKQQITVEKVSLEEIEQVLQSFYNAYPERKDVREFFNVVQKWMPKLENHLQRELIEAVALDDFFFHQRKDIWTSYLKRTIKKMVRPSTIEVLQNWNAAEMFIGQVVFVDEHHFKVVSSMDGAEVFIRRESNKPIPEEMQVFAFLLPDGSGKENHYLAVSTLIFFPKQYKAAFDSFAKRFDSSSNYSAQQFLQENHLAFWEHLVESGYNGEEFTSFETEVLDSTKQFLLEKNLQADRLIEIVQDYLVENKPKARKAAAIAAGAIRFAQERDFFEGVTFTVKEIAEAFGVSASSLNKWYQELLEYSTVTV